MATAIESRAAGDRIRSAGPAFRLAAVVVLVGTAPFVGTASPSTQLRFGLIVALGWLPVTVVLTRLDRRAQHPAVEVLALGVDLSLLGIVEGMVSPRSGVYVLIHLLLVVYYTYVGGRPLGFGAGVAGFLLIAAMTKGTDHNFDVFTVAVYPIVVAGLVWLLDTAATERWKASDRVLRLHEKSDAILTGVAEAVMVTSPDGRIAQWNHAAELAFGCPFDRAEGKACADVLALRIDTGELDCGSGCALLALHKATATATGSDVEVWRFDETGERQPLLATALPVLDGDGAVVEVVHSFRDITKLKQADEAKTLFLATASHELKTPLTVIRGFSQMLVLADNQMSEEERAAALRAIDVRARQLTGIVDRLLLSSRIESGRVDLTAEVVEAAPILHEQVTALGASTSREVVLKIDDDLPLLRVDPAAFTTVVDHLLDNAVKYSPGGGPVIVFATAVDDHVELTFSDEGVGMTDEQVAHCFDRFWQAEGTDARRFGGTGIGLYIVRSLVEAMSGRIFVSSAPGEGAAFTVELPRADRPASSGEPPRRNVQSAWEHLDRRR
ncbi:MAG: two-component system, OmpR family, phosphate regulon sensor histidine kinase PhoR [Acidimicrobiaceae bacterium]|jgi:PAS domain S-box-containing protein